MQQSTAPQHHAILDVEYDGTPYCGWAIQPGLRSIEGDLRAAFAQLGCHVVRMQCAGRTDAGVHARGQVVDVTYTGTIPVERIHRALSGKLPAEVKARGAHAAPLGFDARLDATSRSYEYRLLPGPTSSPLRDRYTLHHPRRLDRDALDAAAELVRGQHHFTAFTPSRTAHSFFDRTVSVSRWVERDDELVYEVRANAFLRHMVRILVGTMLEVGRGERTLDELRFALDGGPRSAAGRTASPRGLCFLDVTWEPQPDLPLSPWWRARRPESAGSPPPVGEEPPASG